MRLRLINALFYAGIAVLAAAIIGRPLRLAWMAVTQRYSYVPNVSAPWLWLTLGVVLAVVVASTTWRLLQGRRAGLVRYGLLIGVLGASFAARKLVTTPLRPAVSDSLSHLIARVELAADAGFTREKVYPTSVEALTVQWPEDLTSPGYFRRGAVPLRSKLLIVPETFGPVFVPPPEARPGDVVLSLSNDRRRYWVTAFVLDRAGRIVPFSDSAGRVIVASAVDGRPASRLDPLFPEYPNKVPHPTSSPM